MKPWPTRARWVRVANVPRALWPRKMAEGAAGDWDEVTYLRKKPQRASDARSQKVSSKLSMTVEIIILMWELFRPSTKPRGKERMWIHQRNVAS